MIQEPTTKEEAFENFRQEFYEGDANQREEIMENLLVLAEDQPEYQRLINEFVRLENEENLNYVDDSDYSGASDNLRFANDR